MASRALQLAARRVNSTSFRTSLVPQLRSVSTLTTPSSAGHGANCTAHPAGFRSAALLAGLAAGVSAAAVALPQTAHSDAAAAAAHPLAVDMLTESIDLTPLSRVETATSITFPTAVSPTQKLLGLGCRNMRGLVRVYALGVYLDPTVLPRVLSPWASFSPAELRGSSRMWQALCEPSVAKTVRLVVVRDVPGKHMSGGFERAVLPRVKARAAALGGRPPREVQAAARKFCKWFTDVGNMKSGSVVLIAVRDGRSELTIDGRYMGSVEDPCLAWALADMYLGDDGVIPTLREDVADGIAAVLKDGRQ